MKAIIQGQQRMPAEGDGDGLFVLAQTEDRTCFGPIGASWARGQMIDGVSTGYWEWLRKDGVGMRSGHFDEGEQIGEWTTYDKTGAVYKVTTMKPKKRKEAGQSRPRRARLRHVLEIGI